MGTGSKAVYAGIQARSGVDSASAKTINDNFAMTDELKSG